MKKIRKDIFLKKYKITEDVFRKTNLKWSELIEIYDDHLSKNKELTTISNYIFETLSELSTVHSIRKRIKDPEHLIEKIIRKTYAKPELNIGLKNYNNKITDLVGIRVLHLYKEDWLQIHNKIISTWKTVEKPTANIRSGDNKEVFLENDCDINEHQFGYRSVHYLVEFPCCKDLSKIVEIQVRTLFEEAWSEIDHNIRYPYDINNPILAGYLVVFNSLAGSADQMGSFIKILKQELDIRNQQIIEKDNIINELQEEINKSKLDKQEKDKITESLNKITYRNNLDFSNISKAFAALGSISIDPSLFKTAINLSNMFYNNIAPKIGNYYLDVAKTENDDASKNNVDERRNVNKDSKDESIEEGKDMKDN